MPQDYPSFTQPATYEDLCAVPEHLTAEIIDGVLITQPQPALRHMSVASALTTILAGPFQFGVGGPGGWIFIAEPELHLDDHIVVSDIAGWRTTRLTIVPDEPFLTIAPDWVCEVSSPHTEKHDKGPKRRIYAEAGVSFLWQADHPSRTIETFERHDAGWLCGPTIADVGSVAVAPFAAAPFEAELIWRALGPTDDTAPDAPSDT
ncbi:MAG: Uma2 family endonuclease [Pseudomonadota bacterium]